MKQIIVIESEINGLDQTELNGTITAGELIDILIKYPRETQVCLSTNDLYYASFTSGQISTEYINESEDIPNHNKE